MDTHIVPNVHTTFSDLLVDGSDTIVDGALLSHFVF